MKKIRKFKSRVVTWVKDKAGKDQSTRPSTPGLTESRQTIASAAVLATPESNPAATATLQIDALRNLGRNDILTLLPTIEGATAEAEHSPQIVVEPSNTDVTTHTLLPNVNSAAHLPGSDPDEIPVPPTDSEHPPSNLPSASAETPASGTGISSGTKPETWLNLQGLMVTLSQAVSINGLELVKNTIGGLVELIGLYEDAAQGQKEFDDLRLQLECIFDELSHHLSSSPTITSSMENICWSIHKETELIRAWYARPKKWQDKHMENDVRMVLECYRRIQAHLERLTRNANTSTWKIVDQLATENRLQKLASLLWECYNSKKANELSRGSCTTGTRMSVLTQMHEWATSPNTGNVFWMSGMAGTGKTTIAYTFCEQLDTRENRMLCASFFCSRLLPECRDAGRIIPSIAYQLARCSQPFRYALSMAAERDPDAHTRLPQLQFNSLIVQPFSNVEVRRAFPTGMVVVFDALDECEDVKSTKQILAVLLTESRDLPIRFVVSTRPEPAIRDQMEKNGTWVDARVVLHELDSGEVQMDIRTYLKAELEPITPSDSEIEQLVARAGVLFIYAATVTRYIGYDDFGRDPRARLEMILGTSDQADKAPTNEIDDLYNIILRAALNDPMLIKKERDNMKLVLNTVICARTPLTVGALNNILRLGNVARVHGALRPLWSVLHVMGPELTVATLHASFPDYLFDLTRSGAWYCNAATHHKLLAERCFDCIQVTKPQFNLCHLESSYLLDSEVTGLDERVERFISSELRYSCQYWSSHLDAADPGTSSDLGLLLSQFLSIHLFLWMEVRNLTNTFPATLDNLTTAKLWAIRRGMPREMIDLLNDAWRFASTFMSSPVSQSTPHLYISMLPLLPLSSPIRKHYCAQFGGIIGAEGTALDRRTKALLAQWQFDLRVECVAWSPDGNRVAIGGRSPTYNCLYDRIYVLDAFSGTLLLDLSQSKYSEAVHSIAFSPDSAHLVSGRSDGAITVWGLTTGQALFNHPSAHSKRISSVLYSHDGAYFISASHDKTIRVWDTLSGSCVLSPAPTGYAGAVTCIAITSDDFRLVSGSEFGTICVWDLQNGKMIMEPIKSKIGKISAIVLSPDDSYIVAGGDWGIEGWDGQTGQTILGPLKEQRSITSLLFSPDGLTIASTSYEKSISIRDAASGEIVSQLGSFYDYLRDGAWLAYSPDGTRIIFARWDGAIRLLNTQTAATAPDPLPGHTYRIVSIDISPNGRYAVSGSWDFTLHIWDLAQGTLLAKQEHDHMVRMVRFSPDGSRIVSCSDDSTIRQWDVPSGTEHGILMQLYTSGRINSAIYSRAGTHIVSLTGLGELAVWDSSNCKIVFGPFQSPSHMSAGVHADFSPDETKVFAGYGDGSILVWDVQNGQMMSHHKGYGRLVKFLDLSINGPYYAQAALGGQKNLYLIHGGEQDSEPGVFEGHIGALEAARFSSDSTQLVSGSEDKTVHVWNVATRQSLLGPLKGHTDRVSSVAFSPDGKFVISAAEDWVIRVWNIEPQALFGEARDAEYADWALDKDGWVVSQSSRRLFWVPTDLHASLMSPRNTALLSQEGYVRLNFEGACLGEVWAGCWRNS